MTDTSSDTPAGAGMGPGSGGFGQLREYPQLHIRVTVASDEEVSDVHWAILPPDAGLQKRLPRTGKLYVLWYLYVFDIQTGLALPMSPNATNASLITAIEVKPDTDGDPWPGTPPARLEVNPEKCWSHDIWYSELDHPPTPRDGSLFKYVLRLQVNGETETKDGHPIEVDPDVRIGPEGP